MFYLLLFLLITQRLWELRLANQNTVKIKAMGGLEVGQEHYKWIMLLHALFFISLLIEYQINRLPALPLWWTIPFSLFLLAQLLRFWTIRSLGPFWNTRIYIVPGIRILPKGPYQWIRHPNYLVVIIELLSIPLIFGLFFTAIVFSLSNILVLVQRIRTEEAALCANTDYDLSMESKPRFIPITKWLIPWFREK